MENIEDEILLPNLDEPTSPIHRPKLKRLKKSSSSTAVAAIADAIRVSDDPVVSIQDQDATAASEWRDLDIEEGFEDDLDPLFSVPSVDPILTESVSPISEPNDVGDGKDFEDDLDPLFSVPAVEEGFETLDLEREREEEEDEGFEKWGIRGGIEKEKSVRKRLNMEEGSEEISKKRKKRNKADKYNEKPKESIRETRKTEKERKAQLEQIHAECQRLLRETRDASFKAVPLVQKPISSVLEKIRRRKLEVLKKTSILCQSDSVSRSDCSVDEIAQDSTLTRNHNNAGENDEDAQVDDLAHVQVAAGSHRSPQNPCEEIPCNNASQIDLKNAPLTPISKNQEAVKNLGSNDRDNDQLDDSPNTSLPATDLNPSPDYLSSSSEEDNDKENIDPRPPRAVTAVNMDSSPEVALAKVFLDDEAEEEDDSDHDLMRFQENEEDDESDADEVLNDLIATGYKEAPKDHEKRNLLHQKWLEQQDAAGTDDILQRLKYGQKQRESTSLLGEEEDEDEDDEEFGEECEDERSHDFPPNDVVRQNSKKAKQMIAQMFNGADDVYVQSDDEESEHTLLRQRVLKQKNKPSIIPPVEDEHSREVFGLIKKLNIAPHIKKRGKTVTSSFDSLVMGGNSNCSSKSSFLNRATSTSLSSLHKQASTTVRAFIFGRDDSNSRSGITTSENISDMDLKQNHPSKPATSNKFSRSSQAKSTASQTKIEPNSSSTSSSLFQILRHSSTHFDKQLNKNSSHQKITDTQVAHQFSAFKLGKRVTKVESRF